MPPRTPTYHPELSSAAPLASGRRRSTNTVGRTSVRQEVVGLKPDLRERMRRNGSKAATSIHSPIEPPPYDPRALTLCVAGPGGGGSLSRMVTVVLAGVPSVAPPAALDNE